MAVSAAARTPSLTRPPFLPSDLTPPHRLLPRIATAHVAAAARGGDTSPSEIARRYWPKDPRIAPLVERAAVSPATTTVSGWASQLSPASVGPFLQSLSDSASGALLNAAPRFSLDGIYSLALPHASATGQPQWVAEGSPAPVAQGAIVNATLGPVRKLIVFESLTRETAEANPEDVETIIAGLLETSITRALDLVLFSNSAATAVAPPGIAAGITASTAATGGGIGAALTDLRTLTDQIVTNGGSGDVLFFTSPGRKLTLAGYFPELASRIYASATIPSGTIYGIDPRSFAAGFGADVEVRSAREGLLHYEDVSPQPISASGTPNTIAAPVREAFQQDLIILRAILRAAWVLRIPGAASWINSGVTW
jgi:hypothetical protein